MPHTNLLEEGVSLPQPENYIDLRSGKVTSLSQFAKNQVKEFYLVKSADSFKIAWPIQESHGICQEPMLLHLLPTLHMTRSHHIGVETYISPTCKTIRNYNANSSWQPQETEKLYYSCIKYWNSME